MTIATSRNLTIGGIGAIVAGIGNALVQYQTGGLAAVNWQAFYTIVVMGIFAILSKGAQSTGGTVDSAGKPVPVPADPVNPGPKGYARIGLLLLLATGCAGVSALSGSTGPIPLTTGKDASGATVATSTVMVTAGPAVLTGGSCFKPLELQFDSLAGQHDNCKITVPLAPVNGACP